MEVDESQKRDRRLRRCEDKAEAGHGKAGGCKAFNAGLRGKKHQGISKEFYKWQPENSWS